MNIVKMKIHHVITNLYKTILVKNTIQNLITWDLSKENFIIVLHIFVCLILGEHIVKKFLINDYENECKAMEE